MSSQLKSVEVKIKFPLVGELTGTWEANEAQQLAAWEMYVELVTRIAVVSLGEDEGLLRDALSSVHSLFGTTREILRRYGPLVARSTRPEMLTFGVIAVAVLNRALRPFLAKWHPLLADHEEDPKFAGKSRLARDKDWALAKDLRTDLKALRLVLQAYAGLLADVAGVASLVEESAARST